MNSCLYIKDNGMSCLHMIKEGKGIIYASGDNRFEYCKQNLFISEYKTNKPNTDGERRFVLSVRLDGSNKDDGRCKLTQMNFTKFELLDLKNRIDEMLMK
ncbi:hypothetical protein D3C87_980430 [compost metagenome]